MLFPSVLWHCWLGNRKGIRPVERWVLVCWWWLSDWSFVHLIYLIAPVVTITTSIILISTKNPEWKTFWVPVNPCSPRKMSVKRESNSSITNKKYTVKDPLIDSPRNNMVQLHRELKSSSHGQSYCAQCALNLISKTRRFRLNRKDLSKKENLESTAVNVTSMKLKSVKETGAVWSVDGPLQI